METQTNPEKKTTPSPSGLIEWDAYGTQYDSMCAINPAYAENIELVTKYASSIGLGNTPRVCDLGAGTGNFIVALHSAFPEASFDHIDSSTEMNMHARAKYQSLGIKAHIHQLRIQEMNLEENVYDLAICINALFYAAPQEEVLKKILLGLKPGGHFLVIDFGRKQKILDWTTYVLKNIWKDRGASGLFKFLKENKEGFRQNRRAAIDQKNGTMWLHSTTEFQSKLEHAGFSVRHIQRCYRDYCDFAVCTRPSERLQD